MKLNIAYDVTPKKRSCRSAQVMDHFGIGFDEGSHVIAGDLELPIERGDVVCFTGPSGSGKSSLMREAAKELVESGYSVLNLDDLQAGDRVVIDNFDCSVPEAMGFLAAAGLSEARLLLRTPGELSDGQRYRFRLALAFSKRPDFIVADEFTATLDRVLAKVVAFNLRRLSGRLGSGFLLATTHEDILQDLEPTTHVRCELNGEIQVIGADNEQRGDARKKNGRSASSKTFTSRPDRQKTGRIFLGGIIAGIRSRS